MEHATTRTTAEMEERLLHISSSFAKVRAQGLGDQAHPELVAIRQEHMELHARWRDAVEGEGGMVAA